MVNAAVRILFIAFTYTGFASVASSNDESNGVEYNSAESSLVQSTTSLGNTRRDNTGNERTNPDSQVEDELKLSSDLIEHLYSLDILPTSQSHELSLTDKRVTIVTFFASWCPPCLDEFHALNELNRELENNISIIAVNVFEEFDDNDTPRMQWFLNVTKPSFLLVKGTEETLALFDGVNRIPTLYAFDKNGTKAFTFIHVRDAIKRSVDFSELKEVILPLL